MENIQDSVNRSPKSHHCPERFSRGAIATWDRSIHHFLSNYPVTSDPAQLLIKPRRAAPIIAVLFAPRRKERLMTEHGLTCDGEDQQDRRPQHRPHRAAHTLSSCPQSVLTVLLRMSSARPLPCVRPHSLLSHRPQCCSPSTGRSQSVCSLSAAYPQSIRRASAVRPPSVHR